MLEKALNEIVHLKTAANYVTIGNIYTYNEIDGRFARRPRY